MPPYTNLRQHVPKTPPPVYETSAEVPQYHWESTSDLNAGQYRYVSEGHIESQHSQVEGSTLHSEARAVEKPGRQGTRTMSLNVAYSYRSS